jgi:hypothetical protein
VPILRQHDSATIRDRRWGERADLSAIDLGVITERILALSGSWSGEEHALDEYTRRSFQDPEGTEFDVLLA